MIEAIFFSTAAEPADDVGASYTLILEDIRRRLKISLQGAPVVGIAGRDLQAARRVGATPVLVRLGAGGTPAETMALAATALVFDDLAAVADFILAQADTVRQ